MKYVAGFLLLAPLAALLIWFLWMVAFYPAVYW